jgi:ribosome biogenesis GTPase
MHYESEIYQRLEGTVIKKAIGTYFVQIDGRLVPCAISPRLRKQLVYPTADPHSLSHIVREVRKIDVLDPVAVGDKVRFVDAQDGSGLIVEVLPRRSKLSRRSAVPMPGAHAFEQVIVANLDQVVAVFAAAQPAIKWNLLDRYLASAESLGLAALICITKLDLVVRHELETELEAYRQIGYKVVLTSSVTGEGLIELKDALRGKVSVLIGKSGVGKTSLLNALQPGLGLRVNAVNQVTGKGKHTTTNLEMVPLEFDGCVVDTPGMREFGLWDVPEAELALYFPEMRPYVGRCRFGLDCAHETEPGCAIRKAVQAGEIDERRYQSYIHLKGGP